MQIVVAGLSHKTAELALREKLSLFSQEEIARKIKDSPIADVVFLSTCNRFEVYACGFKDGADGPEVLLRFFEGLIGKNPDKEDLYLYSGLEAVEHLLKVASGLDSLVVGETEILGQVKEAYEWAKKEGFTGKIGNILFQRALFVGKKVRSETGISVGQTSVASVAVELAQSIFGRLSESSVLVLGAGQMAELMVRHLSSQKTQKIMVSNRTRDRAETLAQNFKASVLPWENRAEALQEVDIVLASTGAPEAVLTKEMVEKSLKNRRGRSLFMVDIAMPRDIEEAVHTLEHVYLYRLEDLEHIVAKNLEGRASEIQKAKEIIDSKTAEMDEWLKALKEGRELSFKHSNRPKMRRIEASQNKGVVNEK